MSKSDRLLIYSKTIFSSVRHSSQVCILTESSCLLFVRTFKLKTVSHEDIRHK